MTFYTLIGYSKYLFLSPDNKKFVSLFKKKFGYYPVKINLYTHAFTHKSSSIKLSDGSLVNNERLEFLGDAILDAVITDYLFKIYPEKDEGFLTQLRSKVVKRKNLDYLAKKFNLQDFLVTDIDKSNKMKHVFGNAFEAFLGALYLERGYKFSKRYIIKHILKLYVDLSILEKTETDFKSRIIEWAQKNKREIQFESYEEYHNNGKIQHFVSQVSIENEILGKGLGESKKDSEQKAAKEALKKILNTEGN